MTAELLQVGNVPVEAAVAAAAVLVVAVAALLALRARRARRRLAALAVHGPGRWWVPGDAVERYVSASVLRGSNATAVRARLRADGSRWRLRLDADGSPDLRSDVERVARRALGRLGAPSGTAIRIRLRRPRGGVQADLELRPWHEAADGLTGRTLLRRAAVTAAVERDLGGVPGVARVTATLDGAADRPELRVTVELADRADPVRARLGVRDAVARFELTTGLVARELDVTLRVAGPIAAETVTET